MLRAVAHPVTVAPLVMIKTLVRVHYPHEVLILFSIKNMYLKKNPKAVI